MLAGADALPETPRGARASEGTNIGKYRVLRELGRGAMACVYEAEHREIGRRVALKVLHPQLRHDARAIERLAREGRVAARLVHPSIVAVLDSDLASESPHLVMDLVQGPSLAAFLKTERKVTVARAVELVLPVLDAIAYAHVQGVVHRDLKPGNIILASESGELAPKVTDFGIGKVIEASVEAPLTMDGGLVGSLPYMAPEQARDARSVDGAADQYAMGVLLYELTTGQLPYAEASVADSIRAIEAGKHAPVNELDPSISADFAAIVARAMHARRESRFPSVQALARELLPFATPAAWARWSRELAGSDGAPTTFDEAASLSVTAPAAWSASRGTEATRGPSRVVLAALVAIVGLTVGAFGGRWVLGGSVPPPNGGTICASEPTVPPDLARELPPVSASVPVINNTHDTPVPAMGSGTARASDAEEAPSTRPSPMRGMRALAAPAAEKKPPPARAPSATSQRDDHEYGQNRAPIVE